jgi:hypothetical protein
MAMTVSVDRSELSPRGQPNRRVPIHIELRVFRYLWEKVNLKLPLSPKCANVGFLDKILCRLVMLDNPARCIPRSGVKTSRKMSSSGRLSASIDF